MSGRRLEAHADAWRATLDDRLDVVRAGILDLIDCGMPGTPIVPREPSESEILATDRADGKFEPTKKSAGRKSGTSNPTLGQVIAWEAEVQRTVTRLFEVVSAAAQIAHGPGLTPIDQHGRKLDAPAEPAMRESPTGSGRWVIDVAPTIHSDDPEVPAEADCRRSTIAATAYIAALADRLADRMAGEPDRDVADQLLERAAWLGQLVDRLARHLSPAPIRRCAAGCGAAAPPPGKGATCGRCRTARWRDNQDQEAS